MYAVIDTEELRCLLVVWLPPLQRRRAVQFKFLCCVSVWTRACDLSAEIVLPSQPPPRARRAHAHTHVRARKTHGVHSFVCVCVCVCVC
ncbi:hypothetical protein EON67_05680 [archaeon]|nr:MAG: hypothetical protein EON67_05680 [archaeon]